MSDFKEGGDYMQAIRDEEVVLVWCKVCGKVSKVHLVAKCEHCGSRYVTCEIPQNNGR